MGAILPIISLAGVGLSAYGQYRSGQDAKSVYEYNAALAKYESKYIQDAATIEQAQLEREVSSFMSRQRAIAGASGTVTDAGSNLDSLLRTRQEADIDAALIRYRADVGSWRAISQSNLLDTQGDQFGTASYINAGGTLLTGASKWDWKKKKPLATSPVTRTGPRYAPGRP